MTHRLIPLITAILLGCLSGAAPADRPTEYQIKALFLSRFAEFVQWPTASFADSTAPITIGVVGEDPFGHILDERVSGRLVQGHPLKVKRFARRQDLEFCHILFISSSEGESQKEILDSVHAVPVLTIGETDLFVEAGGAIRFLIIDEMVRFQINAKAVKDSGLKISSRLLKLSCSSGTRRNKGKR